MASSPLDPGMSSHNKLLDSVDRRARASRGRNFCIIAHVRSSVFEVRCGAGRQSVRWLATTAAQRHYDEMNQGGRLRHREIDNRPREMLVPALISPRSRSAPWTGTTRDKGPPPADGWGIGGGERREGSEGSGEGNTTSTEPRRPGGNQKNSDKGEKGCDDDDDAGEGGDTPDGPRRLITPILPATFDPGACICDVLSDGDHVYLELGDRAHISCNHGATITRWQQGAFLTHTHHLHRMKTIRRRLKRRRKPRSKADGHFKIPGVRDIADLFKDRHLQSEAELQKRCKQEFDRSKIRAIVPEDDADAVLDVLCAYFHELEEIYSFFSTLDNGPINSMSSMEFNEFVRHCGILDGEEAFEDGVRNNNFGSGDDPDEGKEQHLSASGKRKSSSSSGGLNISTLGTIFVACNIEKDSKGRLVHDPKNPSREMLRFEFLEAIVRVALAKYCGDSAMNKPSEKLEALMINYLQAYAEEICGRTTFLRERLSTPSVLKVYHGSLNMLRRVFNAYCIRDRDQTGSSASASAQAALAKTLSEKRGSVIKTQGIVLTKSNVFDAEEDKTISYGEFRMCMAEAHVVDDCINVRALKTIYMQSMQFSYSINQTDEQIFRTTLQQTWVEFLEALARVAITKYGDDGQDGSLEHALRRLFLEHMRHIDPRLAQKTSWTLEREMREHKERQQEERRQRHLAAEAAGPTAAVARVALKAKAHRRK